MKDAFVACICLSERGLTSGDRERLLATNCRCDRQFHDQSEENSLQLAMLVEVAESLWRKRGRGEHSLGRSPRASATRALSLVVERGSSWFEAGC